MKNKFMFVIIIFTLNLRAFAQNYNTQPVDSLGNSIAPQSSSQSKFLLTGYAANLISMDTKGNSSFGDVGFSPIFLWKPSKNIFFESEFETGFEGGEFMMNLEYADISFIVNKYMTLRTGRFLTPLGTFSDRFHPAWINKFPTKPLGLGDGGIMPESEIGFSLSGGIPLGFAKMNYNIYISNGPQLNTGKENKESEGALIFDNIKDNNKNKAVGGRIGLIPFSASALEIGGSFQYSKVGDEGSVYENIGALILAGDINFIQQVDFMKGTVDIKGQFNYNNIDKTFYPNPEDSTGTISFNNKRSAYYAQFSYRPTMLQNRIVKNFELAARYSTITLPAFSNEAQTQKELSVGLIYWFTWRSLVKVAYQKINSSPEIYFIQFATSF